MSNTTSANLLPELARVFVAQNLGINPAAWPLTSDEAWINLAGRVLRRRRTSRATGKWEVVTSK